MNSSLDNCDIIKAVEKILTSYKIRNLQTIDPIVTLIVHRDCCLEWTKCLYFSLGQIFALHQILDLPTHPYPI